MTGFLLTLDLARNIGWSCGKPEDQQFSSGSHELPRTGEDLGSYLHYYRDWLLPALDGVALCVFESPILPRQTQLATARKLYSQAAFTELACRDSRVECMEANVSSIKSFMGVRRAKGVNQKAEMVALVKRYGYCPTDDDEADAIAIRLYVIARRYPKLMGPLGLDLGLLGAAADVGGAL